MDACLKNLERFTAHSLRYTMKPSFTLFCHYTLFAKNTWEKRCFSTFSSDRQISLNLTSGCQLQNESTIPFIVIDTTPEFNWDLIYFHSFLLPFKKDKVPQNNVTTSSFFKMVISSFIKCTFSLNGDMRVKLLLLVRLCSACACVVCIVQILTRQTIHVFFQCQENLL